MQFVNVIPAVPVDSQPAADLDFHSFHLNDHQLVPFLSDNWPAAVLAATPGVGNVIELVHAATLFSDGAVTEDRVATTVETYLRERAAAGIDTLYVVGVWKPGAFSRMVMPFFAKGWETQPAPEHVGPSVFSITELVPNDSIGSWSNLKQVTDVAKELGITLVFDFVPNTTGLGSDIIRTFPEYIRDEERPKEEFQQVQKWQEFCEANAACIFSNSYHEKCAGQEIEHQLNIYSADGHEQLFVYSRVEGLNEYTVYLQRDLERGFRPYVWIENVTDGDSKLYCKRLGSDGYTVWADVLMLETNSPELQTLQADFLAQVATVTPVVRADMSHLPRREYWNELSEKVGALGGTMPEVWGEAYGVGVHDELAQQKVHTYANFLKEWLTQDEINVPALHAQLFNNPTATEFYKRGMSIGYIANHDDDLGKNLLLAGAAATILCSLPITKVLWAQGQLHGDTYRYGADQNISMDEYRVNCALAEALDPGYSAHMNQLNRVANRDVFRSKDSEWRPVKFQSIQDRDPNRIFNIVRSLGDEQVLTVVDCQWGGANARIEIDVPATFGVPESQLSSYLLVDLLSGNLSPAESTLVLPLSTCESGYSSHMFALVKESAVHSLLQS